MIPLAIAALAAVIEQQSFLKAATILCITQSAVSQRIKSLETFYGEPVMCGLRLTCPTPLGYTLLRHFKRVQLLESAMQEELQAEMTKQRISVAISRDSLETWFVRVIDQLKHLPDITLEIIADDQDLTYDYFRKGQVSACATTNAKILSGCKQAFLGYMEYVLVASPAFKKQFFKDANAEVNLIQAPALIFDNNDKLHTHYLREFFDMSDEGIQYHVVPSVAGFRQFAINGYAYALIPKIDIFG